MPSTFLRTASFKHHRRAFTLLELLVVFTVIAVLVGVALMVGQKVTGSSKTGATKNVLQALDQAVDAYMQAKGGTAAKFPDRFVDVNKYEYPLADASIVGVRVPSGELAVEVLMNEPNSAAIVKGIRAEFIEKVEATSFGGLAAPQRAVSGGIDEVEYTRIKDAWGEPIRFVHPAYQGVYATARNITVKQGNASPSLQLVRNWMVVTGGGDTTYQGEGDGGRCAGGRPYFYSAGPDKNPATIEDNVYSIQPQFDAAVKAGGQ